MTSRDIYFYVAGLVTAGIVAIGGFIYSEWRHYRKWREDFWEEERRRR